MSTTKTKEELVRMGWLTELRRQGHRKCTGDYRVGELVCALGLLAEVAGADFIEPMWVESCSGLNTEQARLVVHMNDGKDGHRKHTFSEIADIVESWFPT